MRKKNDNHGAESVLGTNQLRETGPTKKSYIACPREFLLSVASFCAVLFCFFFFFSTSRSPSVALRSLSSTAFRVVVIFKKATRILPSVVEFLASSLVRVLKVMYNAPETINKEPSQQWLPPESYI